MCMLYALISIYLYIMTAVNDDAVNICAQVFVEWNSRV